MPITGYPTLDPDLTAIATLAGTGFLKKTAAGTWALDTNDYSLSSHNHSGVYVPFLSNGVHTLAMVNYGIYFSSDFSFPHAQIYEGPDQDMTFSDPHTTTTILSSLRSGAYIANIYNNIAVTDAKNFSLGTTTGTKFGTSTDQKIGFFNATPIIQPGFNSDIRTALINLGLLEGGGTNQLNLNGGTLTAGAITSSSSFKFEKGTYDTFLAATTPTGSNKTITFPNATGTVPLLESSNTFTNTNLFKKWINVPWVIGDTTQQGTLNLQGSNPRAFIYGDQADTGHIFLDNTTETTINPSGLWQGFHFFNAGVWSGGFDTNDLACRAPNFSISTAPYSGSSPYAIKLTGSPTGSDKTITVPNSSGTLPLLESANIWTGTNNIKLDNANAFVVEKADGTDVFKVDTSSPATYASSIKLSKSVAVSSIRMDFGAQTYSGGLLSEESGTLIEFGLNAVQFGDRNTTLKGGLFRFDTRTDSQYFNIIRQPAGDSSELCDFSITDLGQLLLGNYATDGGSFYPVTGAAQVETNSDAVNTMVHNFIAGVSTTFFSKWFASDQSTVKASLDVNGNFSANKYTSTVATGTAPLAVSSTTVVSNLNADKVDGYDLNQDVRTTASPTFANQLLTGKITTYNNIATEGYGVPAIVDLVSLTGQTADITTTNFTNAGTAGLYRISYVLEDTTADLTAGVLTLTISWTDGAGATTHTNTQTLTAVGRASGIIFCQLASGNISYAVSHSGIFGTSAYALHATAERLN